MVGVAFLAIMGGSCVAVVNEAQQVTQSVREAQEAADSFPSVPAQAGVTPTAVPDIDIGSPRGNARLGEGWSILSFNVVYRVTLDGTLEVTEDLDVDFFELEKHGIFRDLNDRIPCGAPIAGAEQPLYDCPSGSDRVYKIKVLAVTDFDDKPHPYKLMRAEGTGREALRIRIGDADEIITGPQQYRIRYTVAGSLDPYSSHDELYWDASGQWPVTVEEFNLSIELPDGAMARATCFQGASSSAPCRSAASANTATYSATRELFPNEELTIVTGWQKGVVDVPPPILKDRPSIDDYFELDAVEYGGAAVVGVVAVAAVIALWWRNGRDRRYTSIYYLTDNPASETRPLFAGDNVVVEFLPPEELRPAQMGLILDERADTLDVTATIIDLAVRGYLHITEIPKKWLFGDKDWKLTKVKEADDSLLKYEQTLFGGIFAGKDEVEMSDLEDKFYTKLASVKKQIYDDGMKQHWFPLRPETAKGIWVAVAFGIMVLGAALCLGAGYFLGRGLMGVGVVVAGFVMLVLSQSMSRRSAAGSEALRRVLGFRLYVATAEKRIHDFNEQQNILNAFAKYLPYAIVFGCVDKWANAFKGLEQEAAASTAGWYSGVSPFHVVAFSSGLHSFSSSVGSTLASSPSSSGSGGSGFSGGGGSGGGGGGGGGGSW